MCKSCRSRKILTNAPTLAFGGADTAENEPLKVWGYGVSTPSPSSANRRNENRSGQTQTRARQVVGVHLPYSCQQHFSDRPSPGCGSDGRSAKVWQNVARFRLCRHRSLQVNTRFFRILLIYNIMIISHLCFLCYAKHSL